jgi:hypothetical protein
MAVPYIFSNVPGGSSILLSELDANFAYCSTSPTLTNLTVSGTLAVGGASTFTGAATFNDIAINGALTIGLDTVLPTGITGTDLLVFNTNPTINFADLIAPKLGIPASGDLTNCINLPLSSVTGFAAGMYNFLTNPTSANLASAMVDETGFGQLVFNNGPTLVSPTFTAPVLGTPVSGDLSNCTNYPVSNLAGVVPVAKGGTNLTTTGAVGTFLSVTAANTLGYTAPIMGGAASQILYQSAPNTTSFIPNGTSGQFLKSNGSAAPSWSAIDLTVNVTGILPIANGGTGQSTRQAAMNALAGAVTVNGVLKGDGTNIILGTLTAANITPAGTLTNDTSGNAATATTSITFTSTTQNSQFNSVGVGVAASGTAGEIDTTGDISTTANVICSDGILHPVIERPTVSLSGTSVLFSAIPSWVRRVTVVIDEMLTAGLGFPQVQLGTSSGLVVTGYKMYATNFSGNISPTTGFQVPLYGSWTPTGVFVLNLISSNTWVCTATLTSVTNAYQSLGNGRVVLPSSLTQISVSTSTGDTFTGGSVNIYYE